MQKPKNTLNINDLFSGGKNTTVFTSARKIPTQLKHILRAKPEYNVVYASDEHGDPIKVQPKPLSIKELLKRSGMHVTLRGVGFTRKNKSTTKRMRAIQNASKRKNRK